MSLCASSTSMSGGIPVVRSLTLRCGGNPGEVVLDDGVLGTGFEVPCYDVGERKLREAESPPVWLRPPLQRLYCWSRDGTRALVMLLLGSHSLPEESASVISIWVFL